MPCLASQLFQNEFPVQQKVLTPRAVEQTSQDTPNCISRKSCGKTEEVKALSLELNWGCMLVAQCLPVVRKLHWPIHSWLYPTKYNRAFSLKTWVNSFQATINNAFFYTIKLILLIIQSKRQVYSTRHSCTSPQLNIPKEGVHIYAEGL